MNATLTDYTARGWAVMPVPCGTKKAIARDWPTRVFTAQEFRPGDNLALILGQRSDGLSDVDLDCPEALLAADHFLPATRMVSGRKTAPRSHRWYRCVGSVSRDKYAERVAPGKPEDCLVELRGNGCYTLVPQSTHPDTGERYAWHEFGQPLEVNAEELRRSVATLAAASLLARHWANGSRHDLSLALAGALLRAWNGDVERVQHFVRGACLAANDEECTSRLKDVEGTARAFEQGKDRVTGWPRLARLVGEPVVRCLREWLGIRAQPDATATVEVSDSWKPPSPLPSLPPAVPFPTDVFPASVQEYWQAAAESLACPVDYVAVPAISLFGAACGRTIKAQIKRSYAQPPLLWVAVVAPPGSAKSAALNFAGASVLHSIGNVWSKEYHQRKERFDTLMLTYEQDLKAWRKSGEGDPPEKPTLVPERQLVLDSTTAQALFLKHFQNQRGICLVKDELLGLVMALNQFTGSKGDDKQMLLSMWSGAAIDRNRVSDIQAGLPTMRIAETFLGVAGMIQPDVLPKFRGDASRGEESVNDGWAARFLMSYPEVVAATEERYSTVDPDLITQYRQLFENLLALEMVSYQTESGETRERPFYAVLSPLGQEAWTAFTRKIAKLMNALDPTDGYRGVLSKLKDYGVRLMAMLYAVRLGTGEYDKRTMLEAVEVERAAKLVEYFNLHAARSVGFGWDDRTHRVAKRLLAWLEKHPELATFGKTQAFQQLRDRKDTTSSTALNSPLKMLVDLGYIRPLVESYGKPGPAAEMYVVNPHLRNREGPTSRPNFDKDDFDDNDSGDGWPPPTPSPKHPGPSSERIGYEPDFGTEKSETVHKVHKVHKVRATSDKHPSNSMDFMDDSQLLKTKNESEAPPEVEPQFTREPVLVDIVDLVDDVSERLESSEFVGLDIETTGLNPRLDELRLLSLSVAGRVYIIDCRCVDPAPLLAALQEVELVGHNLAFDLGFLMAKGFRPGKVFDTMLASQVLDAGTAVRHNLADVCLRYLNRQVDKAEQKADWSGEITQAMLQYAALDAELPLQLRQAMLPKIQTAKLADVMELENNAVPALAMMALNGVAVDRAAWTALAEKAASDKAELQRELNRLAPGTETLFGGSGWNWDSPAHVKQAFAAVGIPLESTGDEALAGVAHPLAEHLRNYRSASKRSGTYGLEWLRHLEGDRIYPSWQQCSTRSGRMSCREPNLQQIPRGDTYRKCFKPAPGMVLVKADYSQIELRLAARISEDKAMKAAYLAGEDLHTKTARSIRGVEAITKADRQLAKAVNFGLLYGMGHKTLCTYAKMNYGVELTEAEAKQYRDVFFRTYPGLQKWHNRQAGATKDKAIETRTLLGRRRLNVARYTEKLNTPVQGSGADGLKKALALCWQRREAVPSAKLVLAVHDEIVLEVPEADAEPAKAWLVANMVEAMRPFCNPIPVEVEAQILPSWGG